VEMPPPIRSPELGPPFMSVLACPPPTACP
jgi:hypothetical protein